MNKFATIFLAVFLSVFICSCGTSRQKAAEHYNLGLELKKQGKYEQASLEFKNAIKYHNEHIEANIAYQNLKLSGSLYSPEIIEEYKKLHEQKPNSAVFLFLYGRLLQEPEERIKYYEMALEKDPNFLWAINALGNEHLKQGFTENAIKQMKRVIEIDSEFAPVHLSLARAWYSIGKYDSAMSEIKKYLQLMPKSYDGYEELGKIFIAKNETAKAIQAWENASELEPNRVSAMIMISGAYLSENQIREADAAIDKVLKKAPQNNGARIVKAEISVRRNNMAQAASIITSVLREEPKNIPALLLRAEILHSKNNTQEALSTYANILEINGSEPKALYSAGMICYNKKNYSDAKTYLKRYIKTGNFSLTALRILRDLYANDGDLKEAGLFSEKICENKNANYNDLLQNGLILWNLDDYIKGGKFFHEAFLKDPVNETLPLLLFITADNNNQNEIITAEFIKLSTAADLAYLKKIYKLSAEVLSGKHTNMIKAYNSSKDKKYKSFELFLTVWSFYKQNDFKNAEKILNSAEYSKDNTTLINQIFIIMSSKISANKSNAAEYTNKLETLNKNISFFTIKCFNELELLRLSKIQNNKSTTLEHSEKAKV